MFPCLTTCPVPLLPLPPQLPVTAQALYDGVVSRYSSPTTAALGRLLLPYLFPDLSSFATVKDLVSHLRASDARYRAAVLAEFLDKNQPLMFITLYFIVTRLPDSLCSVRDHFLSLDPTSLTVDLIKQHLLAAETSAVAVGASRGTPRPPFFEGCPPSPLAPSYASAAAADVSVAEDVGLLLLVQSAAAARARVARVVEVAAAVVEEAAGVVVGAAVEVVAAVGLLEGVGALVAAVDAARGGSGGGQHQQQQRRSKTPSPQQLREWFLRGASGGSCPYVIRTGDRTGQTCGQSHTQHRYFSRLDDAWRAEFGDDVELPRWADLLKSRIAIFDLDFDATDSSMAPPLGLPLPATPSWHALSSSGLWSTQVFASPAALACPALPSLRQGAVARRSSLLVSPDDCSPVDSPHGHGGEFSSNLLRDFCHGEGILQSFTLPDSPQQNGIAERRIGLVIELNLWPRVSLPETSPTLRWTGEVGDASVFWVWRSRAFVRDTSADKLSPCAIPGVFLGFVPDAPGWQFYQPTSHRVFPSQDVTFDESIPFYRLFPYRSAPPPPPPLFLAPDPLPGLALVQVAVGSGAPRGASSGGAASGGAEPGSAESVGAETGGAETGGVATGGGEPGGAEPEGVEPGGAASKDAESGGAEPHGADLSGGSAGASQRLPPQQLREWFVWRTRLRSGASGAGGAGAAGGSTGVTTGAGVTGGSATTGPGGARTWGTGAAGTGGVEGAGAGNLTESGATGSGANGAGGAGVGGPGAGGAGVGGTGVGGAGAVDPGNAVRPRPYFVPLLQQVLGTPPSAALTPPLLCPPPDQSQPPLRPASPLPAPSPYTEQSGGLTERREPASQPISPVRTARRVPRSRPPLVPGTHAMTLRPSSVPLRVPLPARPESSLPGVRDPETDRARAASPTISRLLTTAVTDPSLESADATALVAELLDVAAACHLNYATALVAESASASPPSVGGECALGMDVLEDRQEDIECLAAAVPRFASMLFAPEGDPDAPDILTPRSYTEAITGPYSSQWQAAIDAEMASWESTGTYVDEVPPPWPNIVDGMWIFRVKRPPGTPPAFKARYVARGFSQRQGVDYFQTFSPTPKMTTLRSSLHEEIWLRRPSGFTESFPAGTQWSLLRPVSGLRQAPRKWHNTLRTTHAALGFARATADPSLFLRTDTSLPPFYVLVYVNDLVFSTADNEALTLVKSELQKRHTYADLAPSSDEFVEPSGPYPELVGCFMYLMTCTRPDLAYPLSHLACYVAPGRHRKVHWDAAKRVLRYLCSTSGMGLVLGGRGPVVLTGHAHASWVDDSATHRSSQGYTFSLGSGSVSWRSTCSSSVLSSSCEAEIYDGAMAAQELCWLTYLVNDLGEQPSSPPVLYVDNKAMIALCQEHRLEHRTKHFALRYFLVRELQ
ncbi:unnamed protein product [Closterium sp. NIES-53]